MRADVPRARVCPAWHSVGARLDAGGAAPLRPRGDARQPRGATRRRDGRRAGDAPADASSSARTAIKERDLSALRIIFVGGSALARSWPSGALKAFGPVALQPVRLDRGRLRDDRQARRTSRPSPTTVGQGGARHRSSSSSTTTARRWSRESGRIFVGHLGPVRGLHRRRPQGGGRGPDVLRRRRPLRRDGPAVHRRPRRRDDRLRRRERVPRGGRGAARRPRGDRGGRGDRRRRREVRPAAEGVRRPARRPGADRGRGQGLRQGQPGQLQGPARGRVRRRAPAQPDRQGAQAR